MQLGIHVVQPPSTSAPAVLRASAHAAEALGYRSLWVGDRLIEGPGREAGAGRPLDALATLAFLAASTERIRLGTNVLAGAWYPPALLARSLATVDQLSRGRLTIGLGTSPSTVESAAAGVGSRESDSLVEELLADLDASWGPVPVRHRSGRMVLDGPAPGPLPIQRPRPPVFLAAHDGPGLDRAGRLADGWHAPPGRPEEVAAGWERVRASAAATGRDAASLALVARVVLGDGDPGSATAEQVAALAAVGAAEVILEVDAGIGLDRALARYAEVAEAVELQAIG